MTKDALILLVGAKADLPHTVTFEEGLGLAEQAGAVFSEISAKTQKVRTKELCRSGFAFVSCVPAGWLPFCFPSVPMSHLLCLAFPFPPASSRSFPPSLSVLCLLKN